MQVSYLTVQIHSKSTLFSSPTQEAVPELPAPCSQCWRVQKHSPATQNNPFLPTFTASLCALLELTISGHRFCLHKVCSPVSHNRSTPAHPKLLMRPLLCLPRAQKGAKQPWRNSSLQVNSPSLGKAGWCPTRKATLKPSQCCCHTAAQPQLSFRQATRPPCLVLRLLLWQKPSAITHCCSNSCDPRTFLSTLLLQLRPTVLQIRQLPVFSPQVKLLVCKTTKTQFPQNNSPSLWAAFSRDAGLRIANTMLNHKYFLKLITYFC